MKLRLETILKYVSCTLIFIYAASHSSTAQADSTYLENVKGELTKTWPQSRTINLVFHGHSVPSGYFVTPDVRKFASYPHLALVKIKEEYPYAVINSITTSIGGEHAESGAERFTAEVLTMRPDVLFIDYALNDRSMGLERSKVAWQKMIDLALTHRFASHDGQQHTIKVVLMTPTPDTGEDILSDDAPLAQHARQIRELAKQNDVGLVDSYALFKEIAKREPLFSYMAQANHVNAKGHQVVADAIADLFVKEEKMADHTHIKNH